jgi:hypothetical protein
MIDDMTLIALVQVFCGATRGRQKMVRTACLLESHECEVLSLLKSPLGFGEKRKLEPW